MSLKKIISVVLATATASSILSACAISPVRSSITASDGLELYADWLGERVGTDKNIVIGDSSAAEAYGIDMSDFQSEGYLIRTLGDETVIFGADEKGVDLAVHDFANNGGRDRTYNEGYRVKRITLAGYDIGDYKIVIPENADDNVVFAAENIRDYTAKACGAKLEITTAPCERAITFVMDETGELGTDGFTIATSDGSMTITHGLYRGALNGAMEFLEAYIGWRFVYNPFDWNETGADGAVDYLYESEHVEIPADVYDMQTPSMEYRDVYDSRMYGSDKGHASYTYKIKYNGEGSLRGTDNAKFGAFRGLMQKSCHGLLNMNMEVIKDLTDNYSHQPCYSDNWWFDEVSDRIINDAMSQVRSGKRIGVDLTCYDISGCDSGAFCQCDGCMEILSEDGAQSGAMLRFVNYVADRINEVPELRGLYVSCLAYYGLNKPPKVTVPRENVQVSYCFYPDPTTGDSPCGNHCFDGTEAHDCVNKQYASEFEKWCEISTKVSVWYYYEFYFPCVPFLEFEVLRRNMKYMADEGCYGVFCLEGISNSGAGYDQLIKYLTCRLMWDADISKEDYYAMIEEYFMICYGEEVGAMMYEYACLLEHAGDLNGCYTQIRSGPFSRVNKEFYANNYEAISFDFEMMLDRAPSFEVYELVERMRLHTDFLGISALWDEMYVNGTAEEREFIQTRYRAHWEKAVEFGYMLADFDYKAYPADESEMDFEKSPYELIGKKEW